MSKDKGQAQINFANIDTREVHTLRKEIVEVVSVIYKTYPSLNQIAQLLNFPNLTGHKLDRIIKCEQKKTDSTLEHIDYNLLLPALKKRFSKELKSKEDNTEYDFNSAALTKVFDYYFIYYYISYLEAVEKFVTKFALVGFSVEEGNDISLGTIYYFDNEGKILNHFELRREPSDDNNHLYFIGRLGPQVNFYTIRVKRKSIDPFSILPMSYSVIEANKQSSGEGLLERILDNDYAKKINHLLNPKYGIDETIINLLYQRKFVNKIVAVEKGMSLKSHQTHIIKEYFQGFWKGIYFRPDFKETGSQVRGGLCKFALYIHGSGQCELHYNLPNDRGILHCYKGFLRLPSDDRSTVKISFEYDINHSVHRVDITLSPDGIGGETGSYAGVISGWTNKKIVYSSPIYMQETQLLKDKLTRPQINEQIKNLSPRQLPKVHKDKITEEEKDLLELLSQVEKEYIATYQNCFSDK